ncbi:MAG TPA: hypothetical protein PLS10_14140 [Chitinophagales bacterium]|nr:hypothetical protein [Chitinophagales bacterium]
MSWTALIITGILVIALFILITVRNRKDRKQLEDKLNNDYRKPRDEEGDIETDEKTK